MRPYEDRPISFEGIVDHARWRLKRYRIALDAAGLEGSGFDPGTTLALAALPSATAKAGRPGVGVLIEHRGRGADYVVLGWWDNENELPLRVFVRREEEVSWRPARGDESVCVWDLEVLWFERNAWVQTVLAPDAGGDPQAVDRYLERRFSRHPSSAARIANAGLT